MIIANITNKTLQKGDYIKKFDDVTNIDELLSKIKVKEPTKIIVDDMPLYCQLKFDDKYKEYQIELDDLPIFDETILDKIDNIKLKRFKPKQDWQLQFGKEVYITNDGALREQFFDKNVFCFTKDDLIEFKKNNWQIDDGYMLRVFFGGKNINFEGTSKPENESL
jgi:hypothetical protein